MSWPSVMSGFTLNAVLVCAAWQDLQHRRIPNRLLLPAAGLGLALAGLPDGVGVASALAGSLVGGVVFSPLYLLRQMGGGDLKLMATAGLLVGMPGVVALCLSVAMAGGMLALYWLWHTRRQPLACSPSAKRMPYAVAVAIGSAGHGLLTLPFP